MRAIFILFLLAGCAFGQPMMPGNEAFLGATRRPAASSSSSEYQWSYDGYSVLARWTGDNATTNGSGKVTGWTDLTNSYAFANGGGTTLPAVSTTLNGHKVVTFDGSDDYLYCNTYAASKVHELFIVMRWNGAEPDEYNYNLFTGTNDTYNVADGQQFMQLDSSTFHGVMNQGTSIGGAAIVVRDAWRVYDIVFTGSTTSTMLTNNVTRISAGDAGAYTMKGFVLAGSLAALGKCPIDVAEIITYNTNLTSTYRTAVSSNLVNKYGL